MALADLTDIAIGGGRGAGGKLTTHVAAVNASGDFYTWGSFANSKLGIDAHENRRIPAKIAIPHGGALTAVAAAAGDEHTGAITSDGQVWAWGLNSYGQLGNYSEVNEINPVKVGRDYIRTYIPAASADEEDKDAFFVESKAGGAAATVKAKYITSLNVYRDVRDNIKFS